jgi:Thiol-disulfide isomerase and thioredoxins
MTRFARLLVAMGAVSALYGQTTTYSCESSTELKTFRTEIFGPTIKAAERADKVAEKLQDDPDNYFLKALYLETISGKDTDTVALSKSQMQTHARDAAYEYLYGRALVGKKTSEALEVFAKVASQAPDFPWVYLSLMEVYTSPNFRDLPKLTQSFQAFEKLCPEDLNPFRYLRPVSDPDVLKEAAARLRNLLEKREKPEDASFYTTLWALEFRAAPPTEHAAVRAQVAKDLTRLKPLDDGKNTRILSVLAEGYKLSGDAASAKAVEAKQREKTGGAAAAYTEWLKAHPFKSGETAEQRWKKNADLLAATEEWVQKWPKDSYAWEQRLSALTNQKEKPSPKEVEEVGDKILKLAASDPTRNSSYPPQLRVGQTWARYDIRLAELPDLLEEGFKLAAAFRPGIDSDLYKRSDSFTPDDSTRFYALSTLFDVTIKLKQLDRAHKALVEMKTWLDTNKASKASDKVYVAQSYGRNEASYMTRMGTMAAAEDHHIDALAYYQKAFQADMPDLSAKVKAHDLWKAQGGTAEGWTLWTAKAEVPSSKVAETPKTAEIQWTRMDKPLPEMSVLDFAGKTWTIKDLKGKTTLINVWATWCGPCKEELPHFEKLYAQMKDRRDVQIISFNVDDEPGLIEPFLKEAKYTFPVLLAKSYFEGIIPGWSIPRNWVVDNAGTVRLETTGFGGDGDKWVSQVTARLNDPLK